MHSMRPSLRQLSLQIGKMYKYLFIVLRGHSKADFGIRNYKK